MEYYCKDQEALNIAQPNRRTVNLSPIPSVQQVIDRFLRFLTNFLSKDAFKCASKLHQTLDLNIFKNWRFHGTHRTRATLNNSLNMFNRCRRKKRFAGFSADSCRNILNNIEFSVNLKIIGHGCINHSLLHQCITASSKSRILIFRMIL